jgi:hypothetical protein
MLRMQGNREAHAVGSTALTAKAQVFGFGKQLAHARSILFHPACVDGEGRGETRHRSQVAVVAIQYLPIDRLDLRKQDTDPGTVLLPRLATYT